MPESLGLPDEDRNADSSGKRSAGASSSGLEESGSPCAESERLRLAHRRQQDWLRWGAYLSERQWGTVREDYSAEQDAWRFFSHERARSQSYRWGEDGLLGLCDRQCRLCFAPVLWNERDPILKERLFGLTGPEGNHGEDVKECYYYLEATPTGSYLKGLYKYPQAEFPYQQLVEENRRRGKDETEYELVDTGVFDDGRYFDCQFEYAKAAPEDILIRLRLTNRGPDPAPLHVLPQVWFRNMWIWGCEHEGCTLKPQAQLDEQGRVQLRHQSLGEFVFAVDTAGQELSEWLFTENETNPQLHPGWPTTGDFYKDAFHRAVVGGDASAVDPSQRGTKVAAHLRRELAPGETWEIRCRLLPQPEDGKVEFGESFDRMFAQRIEEADAFYAERTPATLTDEERRVMRQSYAGLIWTKQFYQYIIQPWLDGDPAMPPPPESRRQGRNADWLHLFNHDVISMPDKWEYPWYAAWDLAFHMVPMADIDLKFAEEQLVLFLREWYMHPNGQIPAYEWALSDVNPPVHAAACWQVYLRGRAQGRPNRDFLARTFQKLLLNFTWWVNRKDVQGRHLFSGGFLGLDNIGVFDRSKPLPGGGTLNQADATGWMAFYCGQMLEMALELAIDELAYGDMASKFFEHYMAIASAMNTLHGTGLWDEADGFYYDHLENDGQLQPLRVRSLVGLIPLCTPVLLSEDHIARLPGFYRRTAWFLRYSQDLGEHMTYLEKPSAAADGQSGLRLLAIPSRSRFERLLTYLLDEKEFLSPYGIRSLSAVHAEYPFTLDCQGEQHTVGYVPGESDTYMFGGNSNWRGPVWFPINYLIIASLRTYYRYYGEDLTVECPTGSGIRMNLRQVADEIERRLVSLFLRAEDGGRPADGRGHRFANDPHWKDLVLFYEYFHGDHGRGLGASHQTGWTALVATMLHHQAESRR